MMSQRHARFARRVTGLRGWPSLSVVLSWGGPAAALGGSKHDPDSTGFDRCGEDADRPLFHGLAEQLPTDLSYGRMDSRSESGIE